MTYFINNHVKKQPIIWYMYSDNHSESSED